jgi:hypothetical protein
VRISAANAAHFMQDDRDSGAGNLPRSFRAGQSAAYNVNWFAVHGPLVTNVVKKYNLK